MNSPILVYGASWCEDTQKSLDYLDRLGAPYDFVDIDKDEDARRRVKELNGGLQRTPTIVLKGPEDRVLTEPSDTELGEALSAAEARPAFRNHTPGA